MSLNWNGEQAVKYVRKNALNWVQRSALIVERHARDLLSIAGTGREKGVEARDVEVSKPGEPPRKQTGRLRASVTHEVDEEGLEARVGTNVDYGKHLELGTKRGLLPRPWLRRALAESQQEINQLSSEGEK